MSLAMQESETKGDDVEGKLRLLSRRALLGQLIVTGLLFVLAVSINRQIHASWQPKVLAWMLFLWSLVAIGFAVLAYLMIRRLSKTESGADRSFTDTLTGLPNRKGLVAALERSELGPQEFGRRTRLIDIDLLNLDRVNYEFGTMVGDAVLQDVAQRLAEAVSAECVVGRLGGDEFLVIMPQATVPDADTLARTLDSAITSYKLALGDRGEVNALKARISVAAYVPEQASLHETVVSAKEATAHGKLPEASDQEEPHYYHVPRVTLGAFAAKRWQALSKAEQEEFKLWKRELSETLTGRMCDDITKMLDDKAETNWVDFVTAVPAPGGGGGAGRVYPARRLAEAVAKHLGVPYREVMRTDSSGPESRTVEPAVDAVIDKGDGVLLVSDVVSSGIVERRCVKKLSAAGAHVQVAAWAAY